MMDLMEMVEVCVAQAQINAVKEKGTVTMILIALVIWSADKEMEGMTIVIVPLASLLPMIAVMTLKNVRKSI